MRGVLHNAFSHLYDPELDMKLFSDAIDLQLFFDPRYTCDLDNSSPELRWENPSPLAREFALMMVDQDWPGQAPDSVSGVHWLIYGIPAHVHHLPAGIPPQDSLPNGICQGINEFGKLGYSGPCPPSGHEPHRYRFTLFALGQNLGLRSRLRGPELLQKIGPHCLEKSELTGKYQRRIQRAG